MHLWDVLLKLLAVGKLLFVLWTWPSLSSGNISLQSTKTQVIWSFTMPTTTNSYYYCSSLCDTWWPHKDYHNTMKTINIIFSFLQSNAIYRQQFITFSIVSFLMFYIQASIYFVLVILLWQQGMSQTAKPSMLHLHVPNMYWSIEQICGQEAALPTMLEDLN
jgi:hypothetical protein